MIETGLWRRQAFRWRRRCFRSGFERSPLLAQGAVPVHENAGDRQQRQRTAEYRPQDLNRETEVIAKMKRAQPENECAAPGIGSSSMPCCQLLSGGA